MAGGMEVHSNKFVEQWAANRENLEVAFRFNRRTIPICLTFGVFVPLLTYYGIVAEFVSEVGGPFLLSLFFSLLPYQYCVSCCPSIYPVLSLVILSEFRVPVRLKVVNLGYRSSLAELVIPIRSKILIRSSPFLGSQQKFHGLEVVGNSANLLSVMMTSCSTFPCQQG